MDLYFTPVEIIFEDGSQLLNIGIGTTPRKISGIQKLIQIWASLFLSDPGHHILDMESGGGVSSLLGRNNNNDFSNNNMKNLISVAIDKTNQEVFESQMVDENVDDDEALETAYLIGIETIAEDEIDIKIKLVTKANTSQSIVVPLA